MQFMHVRKTGRRGSWTRIKNEIRRQKGSLLLGRRKCNFCYKRDLARIYSCCVFLHYANNYMMVVFVFWLKLGLIKG